MTNIQSQAPGSKPEHSAAAQKKFMLAVIRTAHARAQMLSHEIAEIGVSLRHDMISAEGAVTWLDCIGAVELVNVEPFTNKIEVVSCST